MLNKRGFAAKRFFGEVRFLGFPLEPLVYQVRDRTVDAAITPFCTLEEMVETGLVQRQDYRVINGVKPEAMTVKPAVPSIPTGHLPPLTWCPAISPSR